MNIINVGNKRVNSYVLADPTPKLLIDTGYPGTLAQFTEQCKRTGVDVAKIPFIIISHFHPDHAGLVQQLKQLGSRLVVFENQLTAVADVRRMVTPKDHYVEIVETDNIRLRLSDSRALLAKIGIQGEIIATPSHTPDSIALILDDGAAFTGDLIPPILAAPDAQSSWHVIKRHNVRRVYPGHGVMWRLDHAQL